MLVNELWRETLAANVERRAQSHAAAEGGRRNGQSSGDERSLRTSTRAAGVGIIRGNLLHKFVSAMANRRTDEYGGIFQEGRRTRSSRSWSPF